jgi:hypothetical protein
MVPNTITKARIDLKQGLIELEGSEAFVSDHLEKYFEFIKTSSNILDCLESQSLPTEKVDQTSMPQNNDQDRYIKLFGVTKEEINNLVDIGESEFRIITTKIKGTTAERQMNYCLLYCLTNEFFGKPKTEFKELRELCEYFSCYDSTNFSTYLTKRKGIFIIDGEKRSQNKTVRLSAPGKEEAKALIKQLLEE